MPRDRPNAAAYVPINHVDINGDIVENQIEIKAALLVLGPLLADPSVIKIGHNMKYNLQIMAHFGVDIVGIEDTMLVAQVLDGGSELRGTDDLALRHLDHTTITFDEVTGTGRKRIPFAKVAIGRATEYAAGG